jgi:hypothetical protein
MSIGPSGRLQRRGWYGEQDRQIDWPKPLRISELSSSGVIVVDEVAGQKDGRSDEGSHHAIAVRSFLLFRIKRNRLSRKRARSIQKALTAGKSDRVIVFVR